MAKKQTMNLLESHFEKLATAIAALFLLWVLYANIINAPGADVSGERVSGVNAANKASEMAQAAVSSMSRQAALEELEEYKPAGDLLTLVEPVQMNETPLSPPDITKMIMEQDVRDYLLPEMPNLSTPKVLLTHAMASVPVEDPEAPLAQQQPVGLGRLDNQTATNTEIKDVMFVSVEASFDMESLYNSFEAAFTAPQVKKKLTENYLPVVATVELLRSEVMDDGTLGEPVSVPRCKVDPMLKSLSATELQTVTKARHNLAMKDNTSDQVQLMLLQPTPYNLLSGAWINPSDLTETGNRTTDTRTVAPAMGLGMRGGIRGGMGGMTNTSTLKDKTLKLWAHDDSATPGKLYKYSIRLGIFNPCFETNWLNKQQADLKYKPILWTALADVAQPVQMPPVSLFVPKAITDTESARVDVYKFQNGQWFRRAFTVKPGDMIGNTVKQDALVMTNTTAGQPMGGGLRGGGLNQNTDDTASGIEQINVDFSTGATVLSITAPEQRQYESNGQTLNEITGEIKYKDADGETRSITTHNAFWTKTFREMQSNVNRTYTADERKRRDAAKAK